MSKPYAILLYAVFAVWALCAVLYGIFRIKRPDEAKTKKARIFDALMLGVSWLAFTVFLFRRSANGFEKTPFTIVCTLIAAAGIGTLAMYNRSEEKTAAVFLKKVLLPILVMALIVIAVIFAAAKIYGLKSIY
jgi:hypothetical protein